MSFYKRKWLGKSAQVSLLLAWRGAMFRKTRTLLLCCGFGLGVGVMITLLAVGEAMVSQAGKENLVGGGEITVLPDGIDVEVLRTGGLGGLFFSVPNARFLYQQILASPRNSDVLGVVAPQIEGKLLYLYTGDASHTVRATGELPSTSRELGSLPSITAGEWIDDDGDRRWRSPTRSELDHDIDHFHLPPTGMENADSWGEWHYFNVLSTDGARWAFISYIIGGDIRAGEWGAQVLITLHERGMPPRRFSTNMVRDSVRFSTRDANVSIGSSTVEVLKSGEYHLHADARQEAGAGQALSLDLTVTPDERAYFPGATISTSDFVSGYAVAALRATATGSICVAQKCEQYSAAQSYHDHNWGGWRAVTWDWGSTRAGQYTILYGRVVSADGAGGNAPFFAYVTDSSGFVSLFRPKRITYVDGRTVSASGQSVRVPSSIELFDARDGDTLAISIAIDDAVVSDTRLDNAQRGQAKSVRELENPWFVQMAGEATVNGRVRGKHIEGRGRGFFETYRQ